METCLILKQLLLTTHLDLLSQQIHVCLMYDHFTNTHILLFNHLISSRFCSSSSSLLIFVNSLYCVSPNYSSLKQLSRFIHSSLKKLSRFIYSSLKQLSCFIYLLSYITQARISPYGYITTLVLLDTNIDYTRHYFFPINNLNRVLVRSTNSVHCYDCKPLSPPF